MRKKKKKKKKKKKNFFGQYTTNYGVRTCDSDSSFTHCVTRPRHSALPQLIVTEKTTTNKQTKNKKKQQ